jgi:hypothetical protein
MCIVFKSRATEAKGFLEYPQEKKMFLLSRHLRSNIITVYSVDSNANLYHFLVI